MTEPLASYAIVSPVKDEAEHLQKTIGSVVSQRHRPKRWVIVDDGSTDATRQIAERAASQHEWISVLDSGANAERARGGAVVRGFNRGFAHVPPDIDVVVKLDGDLFLPAHYFEWVMATFARVDDAGIVGGMLSIPDGAGGWVSDPIAKHNVHGAIKAYRLACLRDIGGLRASMGWDGIDEYGAKARGWSVYVLPELMVLHYKPRGSKQPWYRARWEEGVANAFMGYRLEFFLLRVAFRSIVERPRILSGIALAGGYLKFRLTRKPTVDDPTAVAELRAEQRLRMRQLVRGGQVVDASVPGGGPASWSELVDGDC
jgi:biofilm PGA synthesis N-glycosyltransferase PgaC